MAVFGFLASISLMSSLRLLSSEDSFLPNQAILAQFIQQVACSCLVNR